MKETSVKKMQNNKRKRKYHCRECGYQSDRRFNIDRHEQRIHGESIIKKCCNMIFFKKSDYYYHIEDHHPNRRSSCYVSRSKYKIYGRRMRLLPDYNKPDYQEDYKENVSNRRSMRIQDRVIKKGRPTLKEISTESECDTSDDDHMDIDDFDHMDIDDFDHMDIDDYDNMDVDDYDYESEESTHDLDNYQRMDSLNSQVSEQCENSESEESDNNDGSISNDDDQNNNFYGAKLIQEKCINNVQNNINCSGSFGYQESNLNTMEDEHMFSSFLVNTNINVQENINTMSRLPLKKRILCEINNNIDMSSLHKNNDIRIKKMSYSGKENQDPIDIILNTKEGATIRKQKLTGEQSTQMWNTITKLQRDYLKYIDFNLF